MPTRASTSSWLRPAKASSSSRFTWGAGQLCGRRLSPTAARRAKAPASLPGPQVGQPAADPPLAGGGVVAPLLGVSHRTLRHVVAVDHPDLDLAHRGVVGKGACAQFAVAGN